MPEEMKRVVECRLFVMVWVDLASPALSEAVLYLPDVASVAQLVGTHLRSHLESVPYINVTAVAVV